MMSDRILNICSILHQYPCVIRPPESSRILKQRSQIDSVRRGGGVYFWENTLNKRFKSLIRDFINKRFLEGVHWRVLVVFGHFDAHVPVKNPLPQQRDHDKCANYRASQDYFLHLSHSFGLTNISAKRGQKRVVNSIAIFRFAFARSRTLHPACANSMLLRSTLTFFCGRTGRERFPRCGAILSNGARHRKSCNRSGSAVPGQRAGL
jgi:hypothetical protein